MNADALAHITGQTPADDPAEDDEDDADDGDYQDDGADEPYGSRWWPTVVCTGRTATSSAGPPPAAARRSSPT